jgi:hypothetical protein
MGLATIFGVFIIPGLFAFVEKIGRRKPVAAETATKPVAPAPAHGAP